MSESIPAQTFMLGAMETGEVLIACVDVHYREASAVAAGVWFRGWTAARAEHQAIATFTEVAAYEPGQFYRRELPCLLGVLKRGLRADVVVVDGYVWLRDGAPGLGARLHGEIGGMVVGVAKTRYAGATDVIEVIRGKSRSPLFVSAVGMDVLAAAAHVGAMHGAHRVPTMLKAVDRLARGGTGAQQERL